MRDRVFNGIGMLAEPQPIVLEEGKITAQVANQVHSVLRGLIQAFNGKITFGDGTQASQAGNLDGQWVQFLTPATPDTEFVVPHGIGRLPIGTVVVQQDKAGQVYGSSLGSWSDRVLYLKCTTASVTMRVLVI